MAESGGSKARYFGCAGLGCLASVFWSLTSCCLLVLVLGLSADLDGGDPELQSAFYTVSNLFVGSAAFCLAGLAVAMVFAAFGLHRKRRLPAKGPSPGLQTVVLFSGLFLGGILLATGLPVLGLMFPSASSLIWAGGLAGGALYFLFALIMLWLAVQSYADLHPEEK
jgi:hypothetical protein